MRAFFLLFSLVEVTQLIYLVVDDKSSAVFPSVVQSASSDLHRYNAALNGQADGVNETMTAYVQNSTKSQKSTDSVIYEILLYIFERYNGERYFFLVMDCGPLNKNFAIYVGLLLALVYLGFFDIGIVMFLQRHHSKEICDRYFG